MNSWLAKPSPVVWFGARWCSDGSSLSFIIPFVICLCVWNRPHSRWPCGCGISTSWKGSGCWQPWLTPSSNCTKVRSHLTASPMALLAPCWATHGLLTWKALLVTSSLLVPHAGHKRHNPGEERRCHKDWLAVLSTQKPHLKCSQLPLSMYYAPQIAFRGNTDSSPSVCRSLCGGSTEKSVEGQVNPLIHF